MPVLHELPGLIKYRISLAVTFTAMTGYLVYSRTFDCKLLLLMAGVFCLASGANTINQIQEKQYDARMSRTRNRPLPAGTLNMKQAVLTASFSILSGILLLTFNLPAFTIILGIFNIFWYNIIYTPMKRLTPLAVIPGSLVGAVPLLMGWIAAGGSFQDIRIWMLSLFLVIWQIPHFWLILSAHNNEYEQAGFPGIERMFTNKHIRYIIFSWMLATVFSSLLLPVFSLITHPIVLGCLISANVLLIVIFFFSVFEKKQHFCKYLMISINSYMLIVLLLCILNVFL